MTRALADAVVVVTGAASGIGRATARRFADLGAEIVVADVDPVGLAALEQESAARGARVRVARVDVGDRTAMLAWAARIHAEHGRVDVLVNNAGVGLVGEIKDTAHSDWEWIVRTNYWGVVHGIEAFLPAMIARGAGQIVNVASANGLFAFPYGGVYASTKFAIVGLSEALRAEVARFGVGVSVVCPGLTRTAILRNARLVAKADSARNPLAGFFRLFDRRGVDPEVIARAIASAVRTNASFVKVPFHVHVLDALHRLSPALYGHLIARILPRESQRGDAATGSDR